MTAEKIAERPALDRGLAEPHHLLVLAGDVEPDALEALAVSRHEQAGRVTDDQLQLQPSVHLTGPWRLDGALRAAFDLPGWAEQAWLLRCPVRRGGALPTELQGIDPVLDAFPEGVPHGIESEALNHLRAFARRLGGALRLSGSGAVVIPDPEAAVDLTVYSPVWLDHDACLQAVTEVAPEARSLLDEIPEELRDQELDGYAIVVPTGPGDLVEVNAGAMPVAPTVLRGTDWAEGDVVAYEIRWRPGRPEEAYAARPSLAVRRARADAGLLIERLALALHRIVQGEICDDDGFLVDAADLRA